ncbi:hypothetical protein CBR_g21127 [Chara braunii]|uniref:F-box domain-containing protein n=1 Tax=Chara braunii TaxID=69332 RepID=A0A388L0R2_CHABU|nr:hypothetical protein CBR_g21127 [Chara braunii]|eukprot:GBG75885.1 hypothetical protein CBR_g21127 [Chara braunii]
MRPCCRDVGRGEGEQGAVGERSKCQGELVCTPPASDDVSEICHVSFSVLGDRLSANDGRGTGEGGDGGTGGTGGDGGRERTEDGSSGYAGEDGEGHLIGCEVGRIPSSRGKDEHEHDDQREEEAGSRGSHGSTDGRAEDDDDDGDGEEHGQHEEEGEDGGDRRRKQRCRRKRKKMRRICETREEEEVCYSDSPAKTNGSSGSGVLGREGGISSCPEEVCCSDSPCKSNSSGDGLAAVKMKQREVPFGDGFLLIAHGKRCTRKRVDRLTQLPWDVMEKILAQVCASNGVVACRLAVVCRAWRSLPLHSLMWQKADLTRTTCTDTVIAELTSSGAWANLKYLKLKASTISEAALADLSRSCADLESIDLSDCSRITALGLVDLCAACKKLKCLRLSRLGAAASDATLRAILSMNCSLEELRLKGCQDIGTGLFRALSAGRAPQLRVLDLTGAGRRYISVPLEVLQRGCPLIEILRLSGLGFMYGWHVTGPSVKLHSLYKQKLAAVRDRGWRAGVGMEVDADLQWAIGGAGGLERGGGGGGGGFPFLKELGVSATTGFWESPMDDMILWRILWRSFDLECLDILGCVRVTAMGLALLPATSLCRLWMGWSGAATHTGIAVAAERWGGTLTEMHVAGSRAVGSETAKVLAEQCSVLEAANLSGTGLMEEDVMMIIRGKSRGTLKVLDTGGCRALPRELRLGGDGCLRAFKEKGNRPTPDRGVGGVNEGWAWPTKLQP